MKRKKKLRAKDINTIGEELTANGTSRRSWARGASYSQNEVIFNILICSSMDENTKLRKTLGT